MDSKLLVKCSFALLVQRDVELSLLFIRAGVPTTQRDAYGSSALHLAARAGNLELVTAFVETNKFDINAKGQNDWTTLHEAVGLRRIEVAKYLVKAGANVEAVNNTGETARAVGVRLGIPRVELEDVFSSSFNDSSNAASSPDSAVSPASNSPIKNLMSMETKTSSIGRLNLMDMIKKPKAGADGGKSPTAGTNSVGVGSAANPEKMGSFPTLPGTNNKVSNAKVTKEEASVVPVAASTNDATAS
ncbi:UNVERIFIED_CONTAM: hypothetical protein HDU68_011256 [Siphonaria sp. JEL0065]|nr:hypothetical protein HDU68_011256 [Siphonaria sp. JEL0065]